MRGWEGGSGVRAYVVDSHCCSEETNTLESNLKNKNLKNKQNSQECSPAPLFESIDSLVLGLLYGPTLTAIHDYFVKTITLTIWSL